MELTSYRKEICEGIEAVQRLLPETDRRVFAALRKLESETRKENDPLLSGAVSYYYAHAHYVRGEYDAFFTRLMRALNGLLRSNEKELTARAVNLFAVNAQRLGCFDIAYNYFMVAESFVKNDKNSVVRAAIQANLGDLVAEMGEYRTACKHIRKSIPVFRRNRDDPRFRQNCYVIEINLGVYSLFAGDEKTAEKKLASVGRELSALPDGTAETAVLYYQIFQAYMLLRRGDIKGVRELVSATMHRISERKLFGAFIRVIHRLCKSLTGEGEWKTAGFLVAEIEREDISSESIYSGILLAQLKIDYYSTAGNRKKQLAAYAERHALMEAYLQVQEELYRGSVFLMRIIQDLNEERINARRENTRLRTRAETDTLTRLPNRYALNDALEKAYANARTGKTTLGVVMADIDGFKRFNDTYGHQRGDDCLVEVARVMERVAKAYGLFAARYGGDEFVYICENRTDQEISGVLETLGREMPVSVSAGFYNRVPEERLKVWDYLAGADKAMYQAKRG